MGRWQNVIQPKLASDPEFREAYRARQRLHSSNYHYSVRRPRAIEARRLEAARRSMCSPDRRIAAIQMRTHTVMPHGDIERFKAEVAEEARAARALLPPDLR